MLLEYRYVYVIDIITIDFTYIIAGIIITNADLSLIFYIYSASVHN